MRPFLRFLLAAAAVTLALALQLSVLSQLHLPYAVPDLVLLVVVSLGIAWGRNLGAAAGFAAGLAVDLAPPSVTAAGRHAIVLTLVGALVGRLAPDLKRSALRTSAIAGILAGLATLGNAVIGSLLGEGGTIGSADLLRGAAACALYTAVATPFILPGLAALARRAEGRRTLLLAPVGNAIGDPVAVRTAGQ